MARVGIFLIIVALIAGMAGCAPAPTQYNLTISTTAGGSVTTPGEGTSTYDEGTAVTLMAAPLTGCRFVNWTGDVGTIADVNAASTNITMSGDYSITANFAPDVIHLIFSDHNPSDNPASRPITAYANYIADHSDGKVEIEKIGYYGEILLDDEVFEGVQNGTADCASYVPDIGDGLQYIQVMQMPFMGWSTPQNAEGIFWQLAGDYPEILGQLPSTLTFDTLYMLSPVQLHYYAEGFIADTPDDIGGLQILSLEGEHLASILNMLGANPVPLSFLDVMDQVPKGVGDGFAMHSEFTYALGLLPYFHSHTLFQGGIVMRPIGMLWNTESYNAVVQAVGEEVMDAARAVYFETFDLWMTVDTAGAYEWWVTHGDTVTSLNSNQIEVWAAACVDYVTEWENSCDDPALAAEIYAAAKAYIAALEE